MPLFEDQLGRKVSLNKIPERIISVVPSQTELLYHLGLEAEVEGITKFCVHPSHWRQTKTIIGGTKNLHIDKIRSLHPDLIIANKEENKKEEIEQLAKDFPVWISDVADVKSAIRMITAIGAMTGKEIEASNLTLAIQSSFNHIQVHDASTRPLTAYLIWREPYMTIGGDTFIDDMLQQAGFQNAFHHKLRYPVTSVEELKNMGLQVLLLSTEPYPFNASHVMELQGQLPPTKIILVDGELFSWYGSRMLYAPEYFKSLQQKLIALSLY